ncbi:MAG: CBS domain-containing protein [Proteobacteria bacterium]|nr:CBS domain-containing protein [Pseudomonadota bacterium]
MRVGDLMTRSVELIAPSDSIQEAARKMADEDFGVLPVAEFDRLVGVVTDRDIVIRAVARGGAPDKTYVRDVMSKDVTYVFEDDSSDEAARKMARLQVKRLPVLNRDERLVGILSLGDMATMRLTHAEASEALSAISRPSQTTHAHI